MTKVMIFGTFDHLHEGHRFLVAQAQTRGDVVAVIAQDTTVNRIKGRPPLQPATLRAEKFANAFPDIRVVLGSKDDFLAPVLAEKPDLLLFGYDQKLPPNVSLDDIPCPWERAEALKPEIFKSSLLSRPAKGDIEETHEK